jgi:hypothetical protein
MLLQWTREMGYEIIEDWHPWTALSTGDNPGQVKAGYVIRYGGANAANQTALDFYFLTVQVCRNYCFLDWSSSCFYGRDLDTWCPRFAHIN